MTKESLQKGKDIQSSIYFLKLELGKAMKYEIKIEYEFADVYYKDLMKELMPISREEYQKQYIKNIEENIAKLEKEFAQL